MSESEPGPAGAAGGGGGAAVGGWPRIDTAPLDDPLRYPGAHPPESYLFTGSGIERLDDVDAEGLSSSGLDRRLAELGAAPVSERRPVLAYGSNRSPAQLASKFRTEPFTPVIPVVRGRLFGASVAFAAGVTRYGAIPAALVDDPGSRTDVAVTYLDRRELEALDRTERGHHRPELDAAVHRLELLAGVEVPGCQSYRHTRPVLTWSGAPIRLAEIGSEASALPARTQVEVQQMLLDLWRDRLLAFADEAAFVAAARGDRRLQLDACEVLRGLEVEPFGPLGARTLTWDPSP